VVYLKHILELGYSVSNNLLTVSDELGRKESARLVLKLFSNYLLS